MVLKKLQQLILGKLSYSNIELVVIYVLLSYSTGENKMCPGETTVKLMAGCEFLTKENPKCCFSTNSELLNAFTKMGLGVIYTVH